MNFEYSITSYLMYYLTKINPMVSLKVDNINVPWRVRTATSIFPTPPCLLIFLGKLCQLLCCESSIK